MRTTVDPTAMDKRRGDGAPTRVQVVRLWSAAITDLPIAKADTSKSRICDLNITVQRTRHVD